MGEVNKGSGVFVGGPRPALAEEKSKVLLVFRFIK